MPSLVSIQFSSFFFPISIQFCVYYFQLIIHLLFTSIVNYFTCNNYTRQPLFINN
ncbi:hypothetical protein FM106_22910 [Brachybacterium faecium]|nr:hypothetical protein FM106_22910 [Brachybacterium faecium]